MSEGRRTAKDPFQACKIYGTAEDVKFMFVGLVQRCEQIALPPISLSESLEVFDERYYGLPNLIEALSSIIVEMEQIGEEFLGPLERLTVMSVDYYPRYQPKSQTTTCTSLIRMFLAMQDKPQHYKPFLFRIVTQSLIRCFSHPLKSTVEQQIQDYQNVNVTEENRPKILSIGRPITFENYLPLWKSVLNVTSIKELDTPNFPLDNRTNFLVAFYDQIIESILHIITRLDLKMEKIESQTEENATDQAVSMKPVNPKDLQIFYNLVDFCQFICFTSIDFRTKILLLGIFFSIKCRGFSKNGFSAFFTTLFHFRPGFEFVFLLSFVQREFF